MTRRAPGRYLNWKDVRNVREAIDNYIGSHFAAVKSAAIRFNIGVSTIYKWLASGHDGTEKQGRTGLNNVKMHELHIDFLINYLQTVDCQLYIIEMIDLLFNEYGEKYTDHQVRNALTARRMTHKLVEKIASEQDNELRAGWVEMVGISKFIIVITFYIYFINIFIRISSLLLGMG